MTYWPADSLSGKRRGSDMALESTHYKFGYYIVLSRISTKRFRCANLILKVPGSSQDSSFREPDFRRESYMPKLIDVTELILRDAHQSLMATRMAMEDMVPACADIDKAGYWSVECWGGATFDSCIRFL